ncbi:MAG: hypothetical protein ABI844_06220 [Saprospiraceae bacterium]
MNPGKFYSILSMVTIGAGAVQIALFQLAKFQAGYFPLLGFIFFLLFSILIYHLGQSTASSTDKNRFTSVIMSMIFFKLLLTVFLVIGFDKLVEKLHLLHIVGFLISYLFFTIYEVYFMSQLARVK